MSSRARPLHEYPLTPRDRELLECQNGLGAIPSAPSQSLAQARADVDPDGAGLTEKDVLVPNDASAVESGAQRKLPFENCECPRAQRNSSVFTGLGLTAVDSCDPCLVDTDDAVDQVEIGEDERDLFGKPHAGEKSELIEDVVTRASFGACDQVPEETKLLENENVPRSI